VSGDQDSRGTIRESEASRGRAQSVKIVRVIGRLNIGGPAIHTVLLTEGLQDGRFQSILVTGTIGKTEGDMAYLAAQHGLAPHVIPELGREISWWDDPVALWKLYRLLRRERPTIVHTHTAKAGTLGRLAAAAAGVPVRIHTFHGHVFHGYFSPLKTRVFLLIERLLAKITTRIVAISEAQLADLAQRYGIAPANKFQVIPIGLDLEPLLAQPARRATEETGARRDELIVGFVGRLVPVKDPLLALRAFHAVATRLPGGRRIRLVVVGDGELRADIEAYVRDTGLVAQVEFCGWRQDMGDLYRRLDAVILTSKNEGTPVALIEAMAAGLPFVATAVGGVRDLMVGAGRPMAGAGGRTVFTAFANGFLAEPGDEEGLGVALEHLLSDGGAMARMGQEGRRFVAQRYSKERLLEDMRALYENCLRGRNCSIEREPTVPARSRNAATRGKKVNA
jgi:glycosyltransferase involved in cell wall biosynthesis